jgi:hypothetical protein
MISKEGQHGDSKSIRNVLTLARELSLAVSNCSALVFDDAERAFDTTTTTTTTMMMM